MTSRTYRDILGRPHERTDEQLVESFLTGYVDYYSGGALEHTERELQNLRTKTAELLLAINRDAVIKYCEGALK